MLQSGNGAGVRLNVKRRFRKAHRSRSQWLAIRDKCLYDLTCQLGYKVPDVAMAFGVSEPTVYRVVSSFREVMREIDNQC